MANTRLSSTSSLNLSRTTSQQIKKMENMVIAATHNTPEVVFDSGANKMRITGICTPENPRAFFRDIFLAVDEHLKGSKAISFDIYLNYFNSGCSKCLLHLFLKCSLDPEIKAASEVNWIVEKDDAE